MSVISAKQVAAPAESHTASTAARSRSCRKPLCIAGNDDPRCKTPKPERMLSSESDCPNNDHERDSLEAMATGSPPASPTGTVPVPCTPRSWRRKCRDFSILENSGRSRLRPDLPRFHCREIEDAMGSAVIVVGRHGACLMLAGDLRSVLSRIRHISGQKFRRLTLRIAGTTRGIIPA